MTKTGHRILIGTFIAIILITFFTILYSGISFYRLSLEERFYHPEYNLLKPSGFLGHGFGIIGSIFILIGVGFYMVRKRFRAFSRMGLLKHWLEYHIFLCTLGPVLILYHTTFKIGGLVAVSFWSMVAVFLSGIIGRYIYIQIPRSIEGRELSLSEVREMKTDIAEIIRNTHDLDEESFNLLTDSIKKKVELYQKNPIVRYIKKYSDDNRSIRKVRDLLKRKKLPKSEYKKILGLVKYDVALNRKIERLDIMHNLFKYWHVAHFPFAIVMLIIMVIHVAVTIMFGYRWIF
jgi:hypothetical protein